LKQWLWQYKISQPIKQQKETNQQDKKDKWSQTNDKETNSMKAWMKWSYDNMPMLQWQWWQGQRRKEKDHYNGIIKTVTATI